MCPITSHLFNYKYSVKNFVDLDSTLLTSNLFSYILTNCDQLIDSHAADVKNSLSAYSIGNETSIFEEKGMLRLKCH